MFLEFVSIIINCIFFSSILLLYHISHASLRRVGKLRLWHVALNIATVKDYGIPLTPFLCKGSAARVTNAKGGLKEASGLLS